ncbi:hypothetical protein AB0W38_00395 [Aliarcobacter butzleri]|uniref:hypothetical protein n=1 Tax=Aliarcobacter butzleri TaxID=28197 RepID=UPI00344B8CD3
MRTLTTLILTTIIGLSAANAAEKGRNHLSYYDTISLSSLKYSWAPKVGSCDELQDTAGAKSFFEDKANNCDIIWNPTLKSGFIMECKINGVPKIWAAGANKHDCEKAGKIALFTLKQDNKKRGIEEWKQF